jgi:hypothetical protein
MLLLPVALLLWVLLFLLPQVPLLVFVQPQAQCTG